MSTWWEDLTPDERRRYKEQHSKSRLPSIPWISFGHTDVAIYNLGDDTLNVSADKQTIPLSKKLQQLLYISGLPQSTVDYSFSLGEDTLLTENKFRQHSSETKYPVTATRLALRTIFSHIGMKRPDQFTFTADSSEESRVSLYEALRPRFERLGYDLLMSKSISDGSEYIWHYYRNDLVRS